MTPKSRHYGLRLKKRRSPAPKVEIKAPAVESKPAAAAKPKVAVSRRPMVAREANQRPLVASPGRREHALDLGIQLRLEHGLRPGRSYSAVKTLMPIWQQGQ